MHVASAGGIDREGSFIREASFIYVYMRSARVMFWSGGRDLAVTV